MSKIHGVMDLKLVTHHRLKMQKHHVTRKVIANVYTISHAMVINGIYTMAYQSLCLVTLARGIKVSLYLN